MDELTLLPPRLPVQRALPRPAPAATDVQLREAAMAFEAVYLAEMLTSMGVAREPETFGGGFGAEAFRSFLNEAYAERFVRRGGTGIAEMVYRQLRGAIAP
jgi:Rod binding domain-containing protein